MLGFGYIQLFPYFDDLMVKLIKSNWKINCIGTKCVYYTFNKNNHVIKKNV